MDWNMGNADESNPSEKLYWGLLSSKKKTIQLKASAYLKGYQQKKNKLKCDLFEREEE